MEDESLGRRRIEDLLNDITLGGWPKPVGALAARLTIELAGHLANLWDGLHDVKVALAKASEEASEQTAALVKWTKVLAWMTGAYTVITGGLLIVAIRSLR